jgi:hypothetical protein
LGDHLAPGDLGAMDGHDGQMLPREAELLAFEARCEDYCEREVHEVEWQDGRGCLHLGARRDDPPRR